MKNIIFIPGLLNTSSLFIGQINKLSSSYHIHIADHTKFDTISEIAEDILLYQNMPEKFILGGLSMGGYVAMEILRQAPERIEGLILINSSARKDSKEKKDKRQSLIDISSKGRFKGVTKHLLPSLIHKNSLDNPLICQVIYDMASQIGKDGFIRQQNAIMKRIDSRNTLEKCNIPSCVIVGDEDKLTPPHVAEEMAGLLSNSQIHIIEECGHLSPLEYPDEISEIIDRFASSI